MPRGVRRLPRLLCVLGVAVVIGLLATSTVRGDQSDDTTETHSESPSVAEMPTGRPGFVYRHGATLMLDGAPYRFVGANNYDLTGCHTGHPASESDAEQFFAQLPPNTMTRVWAFEEWGIDGVAQTVRLAEKYGQKLILVFADGAGHCKAPTFETAWYAQGFRGAYFDWITQLTAAFRNSSAIAVWELMNEPGSQADDVTPEVMRAFYDAAAAHVKHLDPDHLVSTGALAPWQKFQSGVDGYAAAHSGPDIDLVSVHEYDFPHSNGQTFVSMHFGPALEAARQLDKPVYVGETGVSLANGCMTADERANALRQKFDQYLAEGAAGVLYWVVLGPPNNPGSACDSAYGNRDAAVGGAVIDMISQYQVPQG